MQYFSLEKNENAQNYFESEMVQKNSTSKML
jgi:hypothetical protein